MVEMHIHFETPLSFCGDNSANLDQVIPVSPGSIYLDPYYLSGSKCLLVCPRDPRATTLRDIYEAIQKHWDAVVRDCDAQVVGLRLIPVDELSIWWHLDTCEHSHSAEIPVYELMLD